MPETPTRSVLESKPVTELREIAKSLDVKTTGLKKAEIVDAIAGGNGSTNKRAPVASVPAVPPTPEAAGSTPIAPSPRDGPNERGPACSRVQRVVKVQVCAMRAQPTNANVRKTTSGEGPKDSSRTALVRARRPNPARAAGDGAVAVVVAAVVVADSLVAESRITYARTGTRTLRSRTTRGPRFGPGSSIFFPRVTASCAPVVISRATRTFTYRSHRCAGSISARATRSSGRCARRRTRRSTRPS